MQQPCYSAYSALALARLAPDNWEFARFEQTVLPRHCQVSVADFLHASRQATREDPAATRQQNPVRWLARKYFVPPSTLAALVDQSGHGQLLAASLVRLGDTGKDWKTWETWDTLAPEFVIPYL